MGLPSMGRRGGDFGDGAENTSKTPQMADIRLKIQAAHHRGTSVTLSAAEVQVLSQFLINHPTL